MASNLTPQQKVHDVIKQYRPARQFPSSTRSDGSESHITSLDFDDAGEFLVAASDDETMQVFDIKEGKKTKTIPSKKYGIHLARFTHHPRNVLFASTKTDDSLRLLELHNESFVRYFSAHTSQVTCIALSPANDQFLSCGNDDMVCLWDLSSRTPQGKLKLVTPYLAAYDPSANVMAIASQSTSSVLMYDVRNFDKAPFATFDMAEAEDRYTPTTKGRAWTKLEFSNDGKSMLLGTDYHGHFVLDAFDGVVKSFLVGKSSGTGRAAPISSSGKPFGQGDACFTQDGRYVVGGAGDQPDLLVWDIQAATGGRQEPTARLTSRGIRSAVVQCNPRHNMLATADTRVCMWLPAEQIKALAVPFRQSESPALRDLLNVLRWCICTPSTIRIDVLAHLSRWPAGMALEMEYMERENRKVNHAAALTSIDLLTTLQRRAEALLASLEAYQQHIVAHHKQKEVETRVFRRGVESELKSLVSISKGHMTDGLQSSAEPEVDEDAESKYLHALRSSNLPFYEAVWEIARKCRGVTALGKRMHGKPPVSPPGTEDVVRPPSAATPANTTLRDKKGVLVDIVAENGLEWIKVSTITEKRLLFEMAKEGWETYGGHSDSSESGSDAGGDDGGNDDRDDKDDDNEWKQSFKVRKLELVRLAEDLKAAAACTRVQFRHPGIRFVLPKIREGVLEEVDAFVADLTATGATVQCGGLPESRPPTESSEMDDNDDFDALLPYQRAPSLTDSLNIDCTILLALVSDISHLARDQLPPAPNTRTGTYHTAILHQIKAEESSPMLPKEIYPILTGRVLECTSHAAQRMRDIVGTMGTSEERVRAAIVLGEGEFQGQAELRRAWTEHSSHAVPDQLVLPVKVVDFDAPALFSADVEAFPTSVAARTLKTMHLSPINASVFFYGWAAQKTTITSNRVVATGILKTINDILDRDERDGLLSDDPDFLGPQIYICETARSLVGKDKTGRQG